MNAFQRFAVTGFVLGVALAAALGPPPWVIGLLAATGVATGFALVLLTRLLTGREMLVYQHHEVAVLAASAGVLALAGRPVLADLDAVALGLGLMLAVGRLGCLSAGCCHGRPAALGIRYTREHLDGAFPAHLAGIRLFPVQVVEAALILAIVGVGVAMMGAGAEPGAALAWFVTASAVERFALELLRGDAVRRRWRGVTEPQAIALALCSAAALAGAGPAHTAAAAALAGATGLLLACHRVRIDDRDIAGLAVCLQGDGSVRELPCGALASAGRTGAVRHVTLSSAGGGRLGARRTRRLAAIVRHLAGAAAPPEIRAGARDTVHVLVAE